MVAIILTSAILWHADASAPITEDRFVRLIREAHSSVRDFDLVCEGTKTLLNSTRSPEVFQSRYIYRADGSVYWDIIRNSGERERPAKRVTNAVLGRSGQWTQLVKIADTNGAGGAPSSRRGSAASLTYDGSAARFILNYFWDDYTKSPQSYHYEFEGWEDIDTHRCARVTLAPKAADGKHYQRFWVDLSRGCHPLKYEVVVEGGTLLRVVPIELDKLEIPGGSSVWFPIHAEANTLPDGGFGGISAQFHETYRVVKGSLIFNQNPPDSRFDVFWRPTKPEPTSHAMLRGEFEKSPAPARREPPLRNNPSQIQNDLELRLLEADRQSAQLAAVPLSRRFWNATLVLQLVVSCVGLLGLGAAFMLWRRTR